METLQWEHEVLHELLGDSSTPKIGVRLQISHASGLSIMDAVLDWVHSLGNTGHDKQCLWRCS